MLSFIPWLILKIIYSNSPSKIKQASQHRGESFKGLQIVVLFIIMEKKTPERRLYQPVLMITRTISEFIESRAF